MAGKSKTESGHAHERAVGVIRRQMEWGDADVRCAALAHLLEEARDARMAAALEPPENRGARTGAAVSAPLALLGRIGALCGRPLRHEEASVALFAILPALRSEFSPRRCREP